MMLQRAGKPIRKIMFTREALEMFETFSHCAAWENKKSAIGMSLYKIKIFKIIDGGFVYIYIF